VKSPIADRVRTWATAAVTASVAVLACDRTAPHDDRPRARASVATEWLGTAAHTREKEPATPQIEMPVEVDGPAQRRWVLHFGDSFVEAWFQQNLRPRFKSLGARFVSKGIKSTYTTSWNSDPDLDLDAFLAGRPSLVIVTLGANEVLNPQPEIRVIHDHCAPCLFFDSDASLGGLSDDEREHDRIHPNAKGGARWANVFWTWLVDHRAPGGDPFKLVPFELRDVD
jgi:lysophospholipase L1-like esterase